MDLILRASERHRDGTATDTTGETNETITSLNERVEFECRVGRWRHCMRRWRSAAVASVDMHVLYK